MKHLIAICALLMSLSIAASTQTLSNALIKDRISTSRAEKNIALEYDAAGKTTRIMATSENFSNDEAKRSGVLAMNFAIGLFYPGDTLVKSPENFLMTFWVLSKKPRFGANHAMTVTVRDEMLVIGSARYAAKPREQMEYLNFEISRENLLKIAGQTDVRFQLGDQEFTFTKSQMKLLADLLMITESRSRGVEEWRSGGVRELIVLLSSLTPPLPPHFAHSSATWTSTRTGTDLTYSSPA